MSSSFSWSWIICVCVCSFSGHKETLCLPRQSHKRNSTMRLLMNSTEWKLLIIENKHLTSTHQMEPAHRSAHFSSHAAALFHFTLSHLPLYMSTMSMVNIFNENDEEPPRMTRRFKAFPNSFILLLKCLCICSYHLRVLLLINMYNLGWRSRGYRTGHRACTSAQYPNPSVQHKVS